jgi:hypothetical protein
MTNRCHASTNPSRLNDLPTVTPTYGVEHGQYHQSINHVMSYASGAAPISSASFHTTKRTERLIRASKPKTVAKELAVITARREPRTSLEWLDLPFSDVQPTHIEDFIRDRLEQVMPGTVDRELDRLSAVINLPMNTWRYDLHRNPMLGVRRPKYFNERNRPLKGDEQARLFRSARRKNLIRSRALALESLLAPARAPLRQPSVNHLIRTATIRSVDRDAGRRPRERARAMPSKAEPTA